MSDEGSRTKVDESAPDSARYIVVGGRRWRATDPEIPDALRAELVKELMAARRAVRDALASGSEHDLGRARRRVQHAKVALGERGRPWWEPFEPTAYAERARAAALALLSKRDETSSICPSDLARIAASPAWQARMADTRTAVLPLIDDGIVVATSGGREIDPRTPGPIRYRRGPRWHAATDTPAQAQGPESPAT